MTVSYSDVERFAELLEDYEELQPEELDPETLRRLADRIDMTEMRVSSGRAPTEELVEELVGIVACAAKISKDNGLI